MRWGGRLGWGWGGGGGGGGRGGEDSSASPVSVKEISSLGNKISDVVIVVMAQHVSMRRTFSIKSLISAID